jgi:hypothetical protein
MLIKYRPKKDKASKLLNDIQISNLCGELNTLYRTLNWKLLYRLSDHGVSMNTFLKSIDGFADTILIFEDESGFKFGGVCNEEWQVSKEFFGNGENFVFTFRDSDKIKTFHATNDNNK